jgi:RNA polymerase sigma factor (sigma-70 family)
MSASLTAGRVGATQTLDPTPDLSKPTTRTENKPRTPRPPLTAQQQGLALKYVPMAKSLAKPLKVSWPIDGEEFESAALLALVEAAQSFDPSRNVKFATFARYRIWGALRDVQRGLITTGWRSDVENAPTITSLTYDAEEHGRVLNCTSDDPVGHEFEAIDYVEGFLRKLPAKHAEACRHIYIDDRTQGEAADLIGCSKSRLSYLHKESLELLKDAFAYQSRLEAEAEAEGKAAR